MRKIASDTPFLVGMSTIFAAYVFLIVMLLVADAQYTSIEDIKTILDKEEIRFSIKLTFLSCAVTALLSIFVAVPTGYLLSRFRFRGRLILDTILDVPIILPPLVVGLSLLILFHQVIIFDASIEEWFQKIAASLYEFLMGAPPDEVIGVSYRIPAVILAQFTVACAFAVRIMRNNFDQLNTRLEDVAMTLGCNRAQSFWLIALPETWRGVLTATALAWARALGEFGPILVFAGSTRGRTEVLSTSVFLEISIGNLEGAVAISMIMVAIALIVLFIVRSLESRQESTHA